MKVRQQREAESAKGTDGLDQGRAWSTSPGPETA